MKSMAVVVASALCPLLLVLAGCSSLATTFDYDTRADFAALHEYAWVERAAAEPSSELVYDRIVSAVDEELAAKGYVRSESPDFLVAARTGTQTRVSVTDWGYTYGAYGSWFPQRDVSVQEYEIGTLILDVVEAQSHKLIWRGTAEDTLTPHPSSEEITRTIQRAVEKVLQAFPPE